MALTPQLPLDQHRKSINLLHLVPHGGHNGPTMNTANTAKRAIPLETKKPGPAPGTSYGPRLKAEERRVMKLLKARVPIETAVELEELRKEYDSKSMQEFLCWIVNAFLDSDLRPQPFRQKTRRR